MPNVVKFAPLHFLGHGGQRRPLSLQGLDAWFFVDADHFDPPCFLLEARLDVQVTDFLDLVGKLIPVSNVGMFPVPAAMGLQGSLLLKNARSGPLRWMGRCLSRSLLELAFHGSSG